MATTPALNLDSLVGTPIFIDGQPYRLLVRAAVPLLKARALESLWERYTTLGMKDGELSEDERQELAGAPKAMCKLVLRAPEAVQDTLDDDQRMALIAAFLNPPTMAGTAETETAPATAASPQISANLPAA